MKFSKVALLLSFGVIAAVGGITRADTILTSFTQGDLVVLRGGDSTFSQTTYGSGEVPAYLDEYTTSGTYVGTLPIQSASGSGELTIAGETATSHEGVLNLSPNGQWLTFAGYQLSPSMINTGGGLANTAAPRVAGEVGGNASSLNTTTVVNAYPSGVIRGSLTVDGNEFYTAGKFPTGGLEYVAGTGPSATTTTLQGTFDWRNVNIFNGQLYGGTGSSSVGTHGTYLIGTPTGAVGTYGTSLLAPSAPANSASNFQMTNVVTSNTASKSQNGLNVMYTIGDQNGTALAKYFFDGTNWQIDGGSLATGNDQISVIDPTGITTAIDSQNPSWVDIYVSGTNGIFSYIDKSGDPTAALPSGIMTTALVAPSSSDEAFYGIAFAPSAVPEPTSLSLLALAGGVLLTRRRTVK